jgi:hypothetical protein
MKKSELKQLIIEEYNTLSESELVGSGALVSVEYDAGHLVISDIAKKQHGIRFSSKRQVNNLIKLLVKHSKKL